jgi:hypothetical protein
MKLNELRKRGKVIDRWYVNHKTSDLRGIGLIKMITNTRVHILFNGKVVIYDKSHVQFLEKYSKTIKKYE